MRALLTTMLVLVVGCTGTVDTSEGPATGLGTSVRLPLPDLDDDIGHEARSLGAQEAEERLRFTPPEVSENDFDLPRVVHHRTVLVDLGAVRTDTAYLGGSRRSTIAYLEVLVEGVRERGLVVSVIFYDEFRVPQLYGVGAVDDDGSFLIDVFEERISPPFVTPCVSFTGTCYARTMLARRFFVEGAIGDDRSLVVFDWGASAITGSAYLEGWRNTVWYDGYLFGAAPRAVSYTGGDLEGHLVRF